MGDQDLGAIRLTVNVNQQDFLAPVGETCGERDGGRRFWEATEITIEVNCAGSRATGIPVNW